ncbi:MAG TPA: substrate-binding domain-containing protein, partial [Dehalococcoidia bacterium]|nr:substrate-binding domain-containing protein [Dehalococcoidia bacterium]
MEEAKSTKTSGAFVYGPGLDGCGLHPRGSYSGSQLPHGRLNPCPISADGSGTVFPITEAVAEEYESTHPYVSVHVGVSGTGVGFEKFTAGATDISNASRPIGNRE